MPVRTKSISSPLITKDIIISNLLMFCVLLWQLLLFFPPYKMRFTVDPDTSKPYDATFIDGGIFANNPEYCALVGARRDKQAAALFRVLSLGTGIYPQSWHDTLGGYAGWLSNSGLIINTILEANRSLMDVFMSDMSAFSNVARFRLNYQLADDMALDDPKFVDVFDKALPCIVAGDDFQSWKRFYRDFIFRGGSETSRDMVL